MRVEVSRLRKLLGPWIDTEHYRLTCDVETDVRRVEGLLRAGAVREAAEAYPGPLLPTSEAPGVVGEREQPGRVAAPGRDDLRRRRGAVGVGATRRRGPDDLRAWKRLLAQLEFRDPRRSLLRRAHRRAASRAWLQVRRVQRCCNGRVVN